MFGTRRGGSTLCPSCGLLVGVHDAECLGCGRRQPGLFGLTALLRRSGFGDLFVPIVMWGCGALYLASLAIDPSSIGGSGLSMMSPSTQSLIVLGGSGAFPMFRLGHWWTILSATWLHGGVLHIVFNMMGVRNVGPGVAHLYGGARTFVIYMVAGASGFLASSLVGAFLNPFLPGFLHGAGLTVGASAGLFGLLGAILHYGYRGGSAHIRELATRWIVTGLVFGFVLPNIDNWAHLGGLAGGYLASFWLDPLRPEQGIHAILAVALLALSVLAVVLSVVTVRPLLGG